VQLLGLGLDEQEVRRSGVRRLAAQTEELPRAAHPDRLVAVGQTPMWAPGWTGEGWVGVLPRVPG
jgi:hypothetical protein